MKRQVIKTDLVKSCCERINKDGWCITHNGKRVFLQTEKAARILFDGLTGERTLSVCDGGYLIPLIDG